MHIIDNSNQTIVEFSSDELDDLSKLETGKESFTT